MTPEPVAWPGPADRVSLPGSLPPVTRVGLVCPYDIDVPGGVRGQVLAIARALQLAGIEAQVLAPRQRGAPEHDAVDGVPVSSAGPAVPLAANGAVARLALGPAARRAARAWLDEGDFDIVHVHEPLALGVGGAVVAACAGRERPVLVGTVHMAVGASAASRSTTLSLAAPWLRRRLDQLAVLTAVSPEARRTVVDHLGRDALVVPNAVDVGRLRADARARPARGAATGPAVPRDDWPGGRQPPRGSTVLAVGRVDDPRKGVDVLLAAWPTIRRQVPDARLLLVGPGSARDVPGLCVRHERAVDDAAKARLLADADVVVAPHLGGESFGLVVAEAMALGRAIVASDLPAFRYVLGDAGLLVPRQRPDRLAAATVDLLLDPGRRAALGSRAADRVLLVDLPAVVAAVREVYALAVAAPSGRGGAAAELRRRREALEQARSGGVSGGVPGAITTGSRARSAGMAGRWGPLGDPLARAAYRVRLAAFLHEDRLRRTAPAGAVSTPAGSPSPASPSPSPSSSLSRLDDVVAATLADPWDDLWRGSDGTTTSLPGRDRDEGPDEDRDPGRPGPRSRSAGSRSRQP